jgi:cell division septal protein FtsQ
MENNTEHKKEVGKGMESVREISKDSDKNKKFYKKPLFWISLALALIGLGLAIFAGIYFMAQSKNKQVVLSGWNGMIDSNKTLQGLSVKVENQESFDVYTAELKKLNSKIDENKSKAQKLSFKNTDVKRYQIFLNDYSSYISESVKYADKINDYTQEDSDKLKDMGFVAKNSSTDLKSNTSYLKDEMPTSSFEVQNVLFEANKVILTNALASKAKQLAEQAATAKDLADKKAAENAAGSFLNAFLAGNAPLMRQYMTEAYQKEYDFNQLTAEARTTTYPASFRILSNQKVDDVKYKDQANVLFKYRDGSSQFTVGYEMNIIYDATSQRWLVNSIKEGNSF